MQIYLYKFLKNLKNKHKIKIICRRDMLILSEFIGLRCYVHNGQFFQPIFIKPEMVGHKFGEFSFTRKLYKNIHSQNKKKK